MADIELKTATLYNAVAKYGTMIIQLGLTMVLSRLIAPEAYGTIAIVTVIIGFLNLFADLGLGVNIVQHPDMPKEDIEKLFGFSVFVGILLAFITCLLSLPLVKIYGDNIYYSLCILMSCVCFLNSVNIVPGSILVRDKKFKTIAIRTLLCSLFSGIVAIFLAFFDFGVYALIVQSIISALFLFCWNYYQIPLKPRLFRWPVLFSLLGRYSLFQTLFNFLNYLTRNLDSLIIGKYLGPTNLAYYNKSYYLYLYPNSLFASVITGVMHPYIREYKANTELMYAKYCQIIKLLSVIGVFTMLSFFYCTEEMIFIMFGENWLPAADCLKCLSLCMWTQMMGSLSGSIFLGIERTDQTFKCGIINLILILVAIFIGVYYKNINTLSLCIAIAYNLIFIITNIILVKLTLYKKVSFFFKEIILDGIFAYSFILLTHIIPIISDSHYINLIYKLVIISGVYIIYLSISGRLKLLLSILPQKSTIK